MALQADVGLLLSCMKIGLNSPSSSTDNGMGGGASATMCEHSNVSLYASISFNRMSSIAMGSLPLLRIRAKRSSLR